MVPPYLTSCLRQDLPPPAAEAAAAGSGMGPQQLQPHCAGAQPALQGHLALRGCRQAQAQANDAVRHEGVVGRPMHQYLLRARQPGTAV